MPRLHSGAAINRPEITKLPPIPEVVWQQPQETHVPNIHKTLTNETHKIPNSPEVTVQSEEEADQTRSTPGTTQEDSSDILPHTDEMGDGTDTDHYMQPDADNSVEQIDPTPANPRSSKYDLRHNPKPNCNDDYR